MKRICMIVPSFTAKGGIAAVVSGYRGSELEAQYDIRYIETYCDGGKAKKLIKAIAAYMRFVKELVVFKPDLIHVHSSFGASFYRKLPFIWIGSLMGIPIINHIHGSETKRFYSDASQLGKRLKRNTYQICSAIIALTDEWKTCFEEMFGTKKIEVVNNYSKICVSSREQKNSHMILFMGFLSKLKGCMDVPIIAQQVKKEIGSVQFVLAGTGDEESVKLLEKQVSDVGVAENVTLPGWISGKEKENMFQQASLFLLPSYTEGMPMSILEAMGYGLPIVSSNVGGIPELVEHGKNGYLCDPGDVEAFASAIVTLLKDDQLRINMGEESVKKIGQCFSFERHIEKLISIYEKVME